MEEVKRQLVEKDIRPSFTRMKIYDHLLRAKSHPTAEEIHQELVGDIPTLSRTTVYNTLKLLEENGLASTIFNEQNERRYDVLDPPHAHFVCRVCGRITDLPITPNAASPVGFHIEEVQITYRGVCGDCQTITKATNHKTPEKG